MFRSMPKAQVLIAEKGYDSNEFRQALKSRGIEACIPPRRHHKVLIPYDKIYTYPVTRSKISSPSLRIVDVLQRAEIDVHTRSSQQSVSLPPSPSNSINEY
jgi:hypothetical protein